MMALKDPDYLVRIYDQMREMYNIVESAGSEIDDGLSNKKRNLKTTLTEQCQEAQIMEEQTVEMCIEAMIRHQPFARDLRAVSAAMKVSYDLSRICRYLRNIAEILEEFDVECDDPDLLPLYREGRKMIHLSLEAYFGKDAKAAADIIKSDEVVDRGYEAILNRYAMAEKKSGSCILFNGITARIIERMADHASYISHETIYLVTGRRVDYR